MIEYDQHFGYQLPYSETYAGLPVAHPPSEGQTPPKGEVAWRLMANGWSDGPDKIVEVIDAFVGSVDPARVTALVIGAWEDCYDTSSAALVERLVAHAPRLTALRALFLGAIASQEAEISWIQQSDVTPLLEAFPKLERFEVRGGTGLALSPVRHEALRILRFETGGLPSAVVRAVAASDLPALEHLELWLGVSEYGGDATVADLAAILSGERLPALRHLGLQDSEIQDEIAAAVASAPVVARLGSLALSMGALTDTGAEALISGQPLTHLTALDLHHHYLSDEMTERVAEALPGVRVDLSEQEEIDEDWIYVAVDE
ncbi:STM4015 family protein [Nonomuraea sp. SBT364]|uniref:STM4015 family protein n=1 Tax=Nonomuraea sp. SBT364 TaxID=1580530 RepID=UPI0009E7493D|nr:STM4015 family protein [Nonomuraea sp. SBT364]